MSTQFLKNAVAAAGHPISESEDLLASDMQSVRNYLHFNNIPIGEEFHRFESYVQENFGGQAPGTATPVIAPEPEQAPPPPPPAEEPPAPVVPEPVVETPPALEPDPVPQADTETTGSI